jgi:RNA polymerase sporulation-specific sigma factor
MDPMAFTLWVSAFFTLLRVHNVKKFDNTGEDLEDLISIGTIGLIKAIESFSSNKGTKLATFAAAVLNLQVGAQVVEAYQ